jgi:hypothetical protein
MLRKEIFKSSEGNGLSYAAVAHLLDASDQDGFIKRGRFCSGDHLKGVYNGKHSVPFFYKSHDSSHYDAYLRM